MVRPFSVDAPIFCCERSSSMPSEPTSHAKLRPLGNLYSSVLFFGLGVAWYVHTNPAKPNSINHSTIAPIDAGYAWPASLAAPLLLSARARQAS